MCGLEEARQGLVSSAVGLLSRECERSLEHVATIPRLYRRTNKEVREGAGRGGEGRGGSREGGEGMGRGS